NDAPDDITGTAGEEGIGNVEIKECFGRQQQPARQRKRGCPTSASASTASGGGDEHHHDNSPHRRSSGRSGARKATTTPHPAYSHLSSFLQEGSQSELNHLLKRNGAQSNRMRQSIILRAVLASKRGTIDIDPTFLGSDGRVYPNLRLAFRNHVDMKPCSLCKSRVQGHWYCRIAHAHVDKPDYDGGNSADVLVDLFRCSDDVLEERLGSLMREKGDGKGRREVGEKQQKSIFRKENVRVDRLDCDEDFSMNLLNEDILYQIASFIPSIKDLISFCKTSKRSQHLLHGSIHSEQLFRGVFVRAFGMQGTIGNFEADLTWKERWIMIRNLRRGLLDKKCIRTPHAKTSRPLKDTIDVLPEREEWEAIYYDNPDYAPEDISGSNGYFGMEILRLPPPPNASSEWQAPVVVRGDFDGVEISNPNILFYEKISTAKGGKKSGVLSAKSSSFTLGDDGGAGQVLSLLQCDPSIDSILGRCPPPCFYIGYASGKVASVSATLTPEGDDYTFAISGMHHAHESEVTDMTFVNCGKYPHENVPVLFSACCAGKVYFYPDALNADRNYSLEQSVLAFSNFYDCPIFSMASTTIVTQGKFFSIICTGDRDGHIRIWLKHDDDLSDLCTPTGQKFRHIQCYKSSTQSGTGYHLVTRAMFAMNNSLLITATNNGDVRFWQLNCAENASRAIGKGPLPNLTLRYDLMGIHNGAIELLMVVGDVLLTSGGNDGKIVGWDISTGLKVGILRCHSGSEIRERGAVFATIRSCVVDLLISGKERNMISLCRDGKLRLLRFV
ncbi:hypothetical protein ACHAXH_005940, partial [Discostella pseudostelligera]